MSKKSPCVQFCEFQRWEEGENPGCDYYSTWLEFEVKNKTAFVYRCKECLDDEQLWARDEILKELTNARI